MTYFETHFVWGLKLKFLKLSKCNEKQLNFEFMDSNLTLKGFISTTFSHVTFSDTKQNKDKNYVATIFSKWLYFHTFSIHF